MPDESKYRSRTSLQDIVERLRRAFGVAGVWAPELQETPVQMSVQVGDLWTPGLSTHRGRYWNIALESLVGAGGGWVIRFAADVVVESIFISFDAVAASEHDLWFLPPDTAPVNAALNPGGTWVDQKRVASDRPPIFISSEASISLAGETAPTSLNRILSNTTVGNAGRYDIPAKMHFPAGTHILFRHDAGGVDQFLRLAGRIF